MDAPAGGVLIGAFADRAGRKPAMLLTIGLITAGTMGLALTPSCEHRHRRADHRGAVPPGPGAGPGRRSR